MLLQLLNSWDLLLKIKQCLGWHHKQLELGDKTLVFRFQKLPESLQRSFIISLTHSQFSVKVVENTQRSSRINFSGGEAQQFTGDRLNSPGNIF